MWVKYLFALSFLLVTAGCDIKKASSADDPKEKITDGVVKSYFKDGAIRVEIPMKNGKKNGVAIEYYQNGKKFQEVAYQDGSSGDSN